MIHIHTCRLVLIHIKKFQITKNKHNQINKQHPPAQNKQTNKNKLSDGRIASLGNITRPCMYQDERKLGEETREGTRAKEKRKRGKCLTWYASCATDSPVVTKVRQLSKLGVHLRFYEAVNSAR